MRDIKRISRWRVPRWVLSFYLVLTGGVASVASAAATPGPDVYVVGAIHRLHEQEESFGYDALRTLIEAIQPDVMALEVRPDELAELKDTPGRPEYPRVIWPLLQKSTIKGEPMELGNPEFTASVEEFERSFGAFEQRDPAAAKWWSSYQSSLSTVLLAHWRELPNTHDRVTEDLARSYYLTHNAVLGKELQRQQEEWDEGMVARASHVVRTNPGRKVLILASYRNRHLFVDSIRAFAPERLVDMEQWLRTSPRVRSPNPN